MHKQKYFDNLYQKKLNQINEFNFDKPTAIVFDNMIERSIPFYHHLQNLLLNLASYYATDYSNIYDCGTATGTTLHLFEKSLNYKNINLIGLDNSKEMLKKAKEKNKKSTITWIEHDINTSFQYKNASLILFNLTLQFCKKENRLAILENTCKGLNKNGALILIEKTVPESKTTQQLFKTIYHQFKENNNYSKLEITQKEKAIKNILQPLSINQNKELLKKAGFTTYETFFQWFPFTGIIAIKDEQ